MEVQGVMAQKRATRRGQRRRRERRAITHAVAHIQSTYNNTIVTITDLQGNTIVWASGGTVGFKGTKKGTPYAAKWLLRQQAKEQWTWELKSWTYLSKVQVLVGIQPFGLCKRWALKLGQSKTSLRRPTTAFADLRGEEGFKVTRRRTIVWGATSVLFVACAEGKA